jgi:hypothetical protein
MLKLDDETRSIPVLTYTCERNGNDDTEEYAELADEADLFPATKAAVWMN